MGIIFKNILSNVLANKRRTALLIVCMIVVSFSAMCALSMSDTIDAVLNDYISPSHGDAKLTVNNNGINTDLLELPDNAEGLYFFNASIHTQHHSVQNFAYASKNRYTVTGVDIEKAQAKNYFIYSEPLKLEDNEIIITEALAKKENWQVGSKFEIMTDSKEEITLTVKYILKNERFLKMLGSAVVSTPDLAEKISGKKGCWSYCNVSFSGDMQAQELIAMLSEKYSTLQFIDLLEANESLSSVRLMFSAIFLILTLIVFIITSGISEHIIRERMSQMGTLRSIGAARSTASIALISENLFYSIPGALIGMTAFIPFGSFFANGLFISTAGEPVEFHAKFSHMIIVLLIAVGVSCLSSAKAIVKAINTPIRDIIFGGKDSAYQLKKARAFAGLALIIIGITCCISINDAVVILLSIALVTVGSILFIPMILSSICKIFGKTEQPMIRLASNNIATKKTLVSNSILFAVVIALVGSMIPEIGYIESSMKNIPYSGDIIITDLSDESDSYRFISALDNVENAELAYVKDDTFEINGEIPSPYCNVVGYNAVDELFSGIKGIDGELATDEISIDEKLMKRFNISEGDTVDMKFNAKGERPIELKLKAVKSCDSSAINPDRIAVAINIELYKKYFFDYPSAQVIKLKDNEKIWETMEIIRTYLMDKNAQVYTCDEYVDTIRSGNGGIVTLLYLIIITGCLLSLIMISTNLSIGFEQRKKELAVLHSTSMSRAQLGKMLFGETALSLAISSIWAIAFSIVYYIMIVKFVDALNGFSSGIPDDLQTTVVLPIVMYEAALIVGAFGKNKINKMNTAAEMKYE